MPSPSSAMVTDGGRFVRGGDIHLGGAGAAGVLQHLVEYVGQGTVEEAADVVDGVGVDFGLNAVRQGVHGIHALFSWCNFVLARLREMGQPVRLSSGHCRARL